MGTKKVTKEMHDYATEQMVRLIENISSNPIEVYSVKESGNEKKYYIGYQYKERLIAQLQKTKL